MVDELPQVKNLFAGIGSRDTPAPILREMEEISAFLTKQGYILRSGGAKGADKAFEAGVCSPQAKEIFLPIDAEFTPETVSMTERYTDIPLRRMREYTRKLLIRNTYILLGKNYNEPVDFVICWTPNGEAVGGTRYGIRLAEDHGIPVYNLASERSKKDLYVFIGKS